MATYAIQQLRALGISEPNSYKIAQTLLFSSHEMGGPVHSTNNLAIAWRFIVDGFVGAVAQTADGASDTQHIFGPETWFGEQPILNETSSYIEYVCVTDVELMNMPAPTFLMLLDMEPKFAKCIAQLTSWRANRAAEILLMVKAGNPSLRIVIGLGMFFEAIAGKFKCPVTEDLADSYTVPVNQHTLAQLCGVSRTSLWETMRRLEDDGWLKAHYGKLELLNLPAWRSVMRRRRESRNATMHPTIEELLMEFRHADMARPSPAHMITQH